MMSFKNRGIVFLCLAISDCTPDGGIGGKGRCGDRITGSGEQCDD
jgi:hypothetical protein